MTSRARASLGQSRFQPTWTWTPQLALTRWPLASSVRRTSATWAQAFGAPEDRADDLALVAAVAVVDRAVGLGLPAGGQVRHLDSVLVGSDPQAVVADGAVGGDRLDLDSEGQVVGVHRCAPLLGGYQSPRNSGNCRSIATFCQANSRSPKSKQGWDFGLDLYVRRSGFYWGAGLPENARGPEVAEENPGRKPGVGEREGDRRRGSGVGELAPLGLAEAGLGALGARSRG